MARKTASVPRVCPPPQSPLSDPKERNLLVRPSGATPTQLIPAPQVTPTPQCGPRSSRPARSTANVSLATSTVSLQPSARTASASWCSSSGRSALATQADRCRAIWLPGSPARNPACSTARRAAAPSTPIVSVSRIVPVTPGPRALPSSVPSVATRATSVLLLPPSTASTAGSVPPPPPHPPPPPPPPPP